MKGFRFSLWSMFLGVAAVAIACAALAKPTAAWAMAFQAAALGVLTFALLAALIYERSAARAFWIGFAVVGWGNLGMQWPIQAGFSLTFEVSEWLEDVIHPHPSPSTRSPPELPGNPVGIVDSDLYSYGRPMDPAAERVIEARNAFSMLLYWIWPLLLGFVGGVVARQLYLGRQRLAAKPPPCDSGPISQVGQTREA